MSSRLKYLFNKYPLVSNSLIYGSLYVGAECSQQIVTKKFLVGIHFLHEFQIYLFLLLLQFWFIFRCKFIHFKLN